MKKKTNGKISENVTFFYSNGHNFFEDVPKSLKFQISVRFFFTTLNKTEKSKSEEVLYLEKVF